MSSNRKTAHLANDYPFKQKQDQPKHTKRMDNKMEMMDATANTI